MPLSMPALFRLGDGGMAGDGDLALPQIQHPFFTTEARSHGGSREARPICRTRSSNIEKLN